MKNLAFVTPFWHIKYFAVGSMDGDWSFKEYYSAKLQQNLLAMSWTCHNKPVIALSVGSQISLTKHWMSNLEKIEFVIPFYM